MYSYTESNPPYEPAQMRDDETIDLTNDAPALKEARSDVPSLIEPSQGSTVLGRVARSKFTLPWRLRAHRHFVRTLRRSVSNPFILEQVRQLKEAILASSIRDSGRNGGLTVAFASPRGGEGVSLLTLLLGFSLGECVHHRVAVLDGSFDQQRFSMLTHLFGLSRNSISVAKGESQIVGFWNMALSENLYFLKSTDLEQSMRFFSDRNLKTFLEKIGTHFDFTLIDLPPLLKESSGLFVLPQVDNLYLVTEAGKTKLRDVKKCIDLVEGTGGKLSGAIVNKQTAPLWSRLFWRDSFF
jgi:Mrp family chromosome partitioning ATPase